MAFPLVQTQDYLTNQLQQNISQTMNPILSTGLVSGTVLKNIGLLTGDNNISHGLGRNIIGWFVIGQSGSAALYDNFTGKNNVNTSKLFVLTASADCTVSLYVF